MYAERSYGRWIDWFNDANSIALRRESHEKFVSIGNHFLDHDLLIVLFTKRSKIIASKIRVVSFNRFEWNDFVRRFRCWSWLGADHASESGNAPCPNVIVFTAHRDQIFLRQCHLDDWRLMHCECLEKLRSMPNSLRMLNNDFHSSRFRSISDLNPVPWQAYVGWRRILAKNGRNDEKVCKIKHWTCTQQKAFSCLVCFCQHQINKKKTFIDYEKR